MGLVEVAAGGSEFVDQDWPTLFAPASAAVAVSVQYRQLVPPWKQHRSAEPAAKKLLYIVSFETVDDHQKTHLYYQSHKSASDRNSHDSPQ